MKALKRVRYIAEYCGCLSLYYSFLCFPMPIASYIGGKLLRFIGLFCFKLNHIAAINLQICMPELSKAKHKEIISDMWEHLGRMIAELPHWSTEKRHKIYIRNRGEYAGCILVSGHFGNWEIAPIIAKILGINLHMVYRKANNPYVNSLINRHRDSVSLIEKGRTGLKQILNILLARRDPIAMLVDQKSNQGSLIKFFNHPAPTTLAPAKISLKYHVPIVPVFIKRVKGTLYEAEFSAPIMPDANTTPEELMLKINQRLEEMILHAPEQWFWLHKRWGKDVYE